MREQPELFFVKQVPKTSVSHSAEVKAWKDKYRIYTHHAPHAGRWIAFSMDECCEAFKGYNLTEAQKTDGFEMLAGFCRLMDESGIVEDNHRTEYMACSALVKRIESK